MHYLDPDRGSGIEEAVVPNRVRSFGVYAKSWAVTGVRLLSYERIMRGVRCEDSALYHRIRAVVGLMNRREFGIAELVTYQLAFGSEAFMPMHLLIPPRQNFNWESSEQSTPTTRIQFSWRLASEEEEKSWMREGDPFERVVEAG